MPEPEMLMVENPPRSPETAGHYFIYGEWTRFVEAPKIASALNPQPAGQDQQIRMGMNEAIAMHPAIFTVLIQETRPGYTVKAWSGISEDLFKWYIEVQRRKNEALKAAMENNGR